MPSPMNVNRNRALNNLIAAMAALSITHAVPMNVNRPHKRKVPNTPRRRNLNGRPPAKRAKH